MSIVSILFLSTYFMIYNLQIIQAKFKHFILNLSRALSEL